MSRVIHFILAAALVSGTFAVGEEKPSQDGAHRGSNPRVNRESAREFFATSRFVKRTP